MRRTLVLLAAACVLSGCSLRLHSPAINLVLVNHENSAVNNLAFYFPGGSFGVPNIPPGETRTRWMRPIATGPFKIDFDDSSGHHSVTPVTLKAGDSGTLTFNFAEGGHLTVEDGRNHSKTP